MSLHTFGFIVIGSELDAWHVLASPTFTMITAGVSAPQQATAAATRLVEAGVQLIELCGGFGPVWTARVIDAVGGKVPVGAVAYGPEAIEGLGAIFHAG